MANYFKIEMFAYDIFSNVLLAIGKIPPNIHQIYEDEMCKIENWGEAINVMFYHAVFCRTTFFKTIHYKEITAESIKSLKSLSDCYDYVVRICDRNDLFGHLTVFERLFTTLSFVINLCLRVHYDTINNIDVSNYAHQLWAMYFEKFIEKFYEEGGWKELRRIASGYFQLYSFIHLFMLYDISLNVMKESFDNYQQFKNSPQFHKYKHVSKQWVKFNITNFENYITVPLYYEYYVNACEAELLLEGFKRLCDPYLKLSNEISETYMTFKSFKEIKANGNDTLAIERIVSEQKDIRSDQYSHEFSKDSTEFGNLSPSQCPSMNLNKGSFNSIDNSTSLKSPVNYLNATIARKPNRVPSADHLQNNHDPIPVQTMNNLDLSFEKISLNIQNKEFPKENLSFESVVQQDDIVSEVNLSGKNKITTPTKNVPLKCLRHINKIGNITGKTMNIGKNIDRIVSTTKTSLVNQMTVCKQSQNIPLEHTSSRHPFKLINKCENTTRESTNISKNTNDLLIKDDFGLPDVHRMILVLGDRQGIEYVLSTLSQSKGMREKAKHKKKDKKKNSAI